MPIGALIKYSHWCQNSVSPHPLEFGKEKCAHGVQLGYGALLLGACAVA